MALLADVPADRVVQPPFASVQQAVRDAQGLDLALATTKAEAKMCQFLQKALPTSKKPMTAPKLSTNLLKVTAELSATLVSRKPQEDAESLKWDKVIWAPLAAVVTNAIEVVVLFCL